MGRLAEPYSSARRCRHHHQRRVAWNTLVRVAATIVERAEVMDNRNVMKSPNQGKLQLHLVDWGLPVPALPHRQSQQRRRGRHTAEIGGGTAEEERFAAPLSFEEPFFSLMLVCIWSFWVLLFPRFCWASHIPHSWYVWSFLWNLERGALFGLWLITIEVLMTHIAYA